MAEIKNKLKFYLFLNLFLFFYWNLVFSDKVEEWSEDFEVDKPEQIKDPKQVR